MFYDRKIKYVDMYENGEKVQNAGFVKLEAKNEKVKILFQISCLTPLLTMRCPIYLCGNGKESVLGEICLEGGKGTAEFAELHLEDLTGGIGYEALEEIQIRIAGNRMLRCVIKEIIAAVWPDTADMTGEPSGPDERMMEVSEPENVAKAVVAEVTDGTNVLKEDVAEMLDGMGMTEADATEMLDGDHIAEALIPIMIERENRVQGEKLYLIHEENEGDKAGERRLGLKNNVEKKKMEREGKTEAELLKEAFLTEKKNRECVIEEEKNRYEKKYSSKRKETCTVAQVTDKWHQLQAVYPHIRPFEDMREYLLIKPQDFVILNQKDFALSSNSFLLHGYYNYEHLILAKVESSGKERFYVGVPGNFYDKEKQVAVMFGFESFEGKREPARTGDFGYYMISVEL